MLQVKRTHVLFYDHKRDELYKRVKNNDVFTIESIFQNAKKIIKGYKTVQGLASAAVHTLSAVITNNAKHDTRFWATIDDPKGTEKDPGDKILAIPIMGRQDADKDSFCLPRGVITAVNKIDNSDFSQSDIDNMKQYNALCTKIIDLISYF